MHTGINYYYFNDAINTLVEGEVLRLSNKQKSPTVDRVAISKISAYMGTVVGASWCYLWCYCSVCIYVP
jgi:hypothetical protein